MGACKVGVWVHVERVHKCTGLGEKKTKVKKTTKKKEAKSRLTGSNPHKNTNFYWSCMCCVCGFSEGRQGGTWGRRLWGWHQAGVCQDLVMAQVFQLLGIRVCNEEHGLEGVEGRGQST